tara:strand:- start:1817 stop:4033 length:2217 start_codon:yes stop_codon:yes gene_type:complete
MAFSAAGFFGQINNDITDQKQYIRARVEEDRLYLREQGLKRQGAIQEQRGQYEQAARSLITRGADERIVMTTLEMDPAGLMEVFRRTDNRDDISGNGLNDLFNIANEYRTEATMDEILNSVLPTIQEMPNDTDPVTSRRRSIASWLGLDVDEAMTNQVYNQQIVGGMTGDQIMAGMNLPVQAQGSDVGGVNFDFSALGPAGDPMPASDFNAHIATANSDYDLEGEIQRLNAQINPEAGEPQPTVDEVTDFRRQIVVLEEADSMSGPARLNAILGSGLLPVGPNTRMLADRFGARLFDPMYGFTAPSLTTIFGTEGDTSEAAVNASGDPAAVDPADPNGVVETATTPEVETSTIEPEVDLDIQYGVNENTPALETTAAELQPLINDLYTDPNAKDTVYAISVDGDFPTVVTSADATEVGDTSALAARLLGREPGVGETVNTLLSRSALSKVVPTSTPEETLRKRGASEEEIQSILASTGAAYVGPSADAEAQRAAWIEEQSWINPRGTWSEFFSGMTTESQSRGTAPRAAILGNPSGTPSPRRADDSRAITPDASRSAFADRMNLPDNARAGLAANQEEILRSRPTVNSNIPIENSDISIEEAIADQQMLQAAFTSDEISREELNTMIQSFEDRYGEDALFVVLNEAQAPTANPVADESLDEGLASMSRLQEVLRLGTAITGDGALDQMRRLIYLSDSIPNPVVGDAFDNHITRMKLDFGQQEVIDFYKALQQTAEAQR